MNGLAVGDRPWLGGPTVVMLSSVDGSPGSSVAAVHDPGIIHGCRTWSRGLIVGEPLVV